MPSKKPTLTIAKVAGLTPQQQAQALADLYTKTTGKAVPKSEIRKASKTLGAK